MPDINLMSDIHLEFGDYTPELDDEMQAIIVAGDLSPSNDGLEWLKKMRDRIAVPIIYVPGNHCFWGHDYFARIVQLREGCAEIGVNFLYNETVTHGDTVYLGTTLWTDYAATGNQVLAMMSGAQTMKDHKYITVNGEEVTAEFLLGEHMTARDFLVRELQNVGPTMKACVVTHHAPALRSLGVRSEHKSAAYYASDLRSIIHDQVPEMWVHGHTHHSCRYVEGETLIMCNPRGYHGVATNKDFIPDILVEI